MADKININRKNARDLAKELGYAISQIDEIGNQALEDGMYSASKIVLKKVKDSSRQAGGGHWKKYPKGWTIDVSRSKKRKIPHFKIWNKGSAGLTHLLENGHRIVTRNGVDTGRKTEAKPHIAPVAEEMESILSEEIEKAINGRFGL